jgi:hypothetical protein
MTILASLAEVRVRAHDAAAKICETQQRIASAAGDKHAHDSAIARAWSISHTAVASLFRPAAGVSITLRDILALPSKRLGRSILTAALASLDDGVQSPRESLDLIAIELGESVRDYHKDLSDGRMDSPEIHANHLGRIVVIALRGMRALESK